MSTSTVTVITAILDTVRYLAYLGLWAYIVRRIEAYLTSRTAPLFPRREPTPPAGGMAQIDATLAPSNDTVTH